jgi:hypothetical protein
MCKTVGIGGSLWPPARATLALSSQRSCNHHDKVGKHMEEIEVQINPAGIEEQLAPLIEGAVVHYGLQIRMRGTLRTYPGFQHWHVHKPGERGTLEVTLWPAGKRVWFSVQAGRRAEWIADIVPQLKAWVEGQVPQQ